VSTPGGWWSTQSWDWDPAPPDIAPGDWITGQVAGTLYTTTLRVGTINAEVDAENDTVSGTVDAPGWRRISLPCTARSTSRTARTSRWTASLPMVAAFSATWPACGHSPRPEPWP